MTEGDHALRASSSTARVRARIILRTGVDKFWTCKFVVIACSHPIGTQAYKGGALAGDTARHSVRDEGCACTECRRRRWIPGQIDARYHGGEARRLRPVAECTAGRRRRARERPPGARRGARSAGRRRRHAARHRVRAPSARRPWPSRPAGSTPTRWPTPTLCPTRSPASTPLGSADGWLSGRSPSTRLPSTERGARRPARSRSLRRASMRCHREGRRGPAGR